MARLARPLLILALVIGGYLFSQIEWLERELMDLRARLDTRPAATDLVLVEIDEPSLRELAVWPWPRRLHAAALQRLAAAGARQVAFDVDFSSASNPEDDRIFAAALARTKVDVVLPIFRQPLHQPDGNPRFLESEPIAAFRDHAALAAFNVRPDPDGKVRRAFTRERWSDRIVPHYAAFIAGRHGGTRTDYLIDFSIDVRTIPRLRFADVVAGRFDPAAVAGRKVLIGATALQLGDMVPVPVHRALPGSTVQVLAYSSLVTGRALARLNPGLIVALTILTLVVLQAACRGRQWGTTLAIASATMAATGITAIGLQKILPLYIDLAPIIVVTALDFLSRLVGQIRRQDIQLLTQSLALRRRDMFMRLVVENSFDAIFTLKPDGEVVTYNHAAEEVFGIPREEIVGRNVAALLPGLRVAGGGNLDDLLARRGVQEIACVGAGGKPLVLDLSIGQVRTGDDVVVIFLARDITAKRDAEAQARKAEQYLADSIENVDAGIAVFDRSDRLIVANSRYLTKPGLDTGLGPNPTYAEITAALAGSLHFVAARDDARGWASERLWRHRAANTSMVEQTADDRWIMTSARRTTDGGTIEVETDITILKRREAELIQARDEAESANQMKTEFLAAMSHELRTPLNAIIGFAEMMDRQVFGPLGAENYVGYARDIHASGKHLLAIINDILDLAKIEAGQFQLQEAEVSVAEVINGTSRLLRDKAAEKGLAFEIGRPANGSGLLADARIVRQTLLNLLSNAVKFTPAGGRVSVDAGLCDDGSLAITVRDTGIGMTEEDLAKAMEPFRQVQGSLSRSYEGTGLGLPLVSRFMHLHGGRLEMESAPGQGTAATIIFPPERVIAGRSRRPAGKAV